MRNYISFFQKGGTLIPDKYFVELKDQNGNHTGHKMIKGPEFILAEDIKDAIKSIGNKIKQYNELKKNLPEVNKNTSDTFSPSIGTTISLADYWSKNPTNSFSYYLSNTSSSSDI